MIIDSTDNPYANNPNFKLVLLQTAFLDARPVVQLTYKDAKCLFVKIANVVVAIFLTLATLGIILFFLKGRILWKTALDAFKDYTVFRIPIAMQSPRQSLQNYALTSTIPQPAVSSVIATSHIPQVQSDAKLLELKETILTDNPGWRKLVNDWVGISLSDEIWLLQVFELRLLGIEFPLIDSFIQSGDKNTIAQVEHVPNLLDVKNEIEKNILEKVTTLDFSKKRLAKCPEAISLLPNLKILNLSENLLNEPPNLQGNPKLEILDLSYNKLTAAPDFSKNTNLTCLILNSNKLEFAPDLTPLTKLTKLNLSKSSFMELPDLSKNPNLIELDLSYTFIEKCPDLTLCPHLEVLKINNSGITSRPDISKNFNLTYIDLSKIVFLRDIIEKDFFKHCSKLQTLIIHGHHGLEYYLDLSMNLQLLHLDYRNSNYQPTLPKNPNIIHLGYSDYFDELNTLTNLEIVDWKINFYPLKLGPWPKLRILNLPNNKLTERIDLSEYPALEQVNLSGNCFSPAVQAQIKSFLKPGVKVIF